MCIKKLKKKAGNTAFLFGSGFSMPFGLPSVNGLTEAILDDELQVGLTSLQTYMVNEPDFVDHPDNSLNAKTAPIHGYIAREFLQSVNDWIECSGAFPAGYTISYEDIYDLIKQYHDHILGEYENPALDKTFLHHIQEFAKRYEVDSKRLLEYSLYFINFVVRDMLLHEVNKVKSKLWVLDKLLSLANDTKEIDIFSLNHDLIAEEYCKQRNKQYDDGFYENSEGLQLFDANRLFKTKAKLRIIKLHGSLDRFQHRGTLIRTQNSLRISDSESDYYADRFVPSIVTGKITKIINYSQSSNADLFSYFRMRLAISVSNLIVVGYGFADKGINNTIASWFMPEDGKKMIVVTMDEDKLLTGARPAMHRILSGGEERGVRLISGGVEDVCRFDRT